MATRRGPRRRIERFLGWRVDRHAFLTAGFRQTIKNAIRQRIIQRIWLETLDAGIDQWNSRDMEKRIQAFYDYMMENGDTTKKNLKRAYADWQADPQEDILDSHFSFYFPDLSEQLDTIVREAVQRFAERSAMSGSKLDRSVPAAGKLTSIQTSIARLERVQSLVDRDLAKLRQTEARLS